MSARTHLIVLLVLVGLLTAGALVMLTAPRDPLMEFRNAEGGITISGGKLTPELQQLLFGPGPAPAFEYVVWHAERSAYPTTAWTSETFLVPNPNVYTSGAVRSVLPSPDWSFLGDSFFSGLSWLGEQLAKLNPVGTASATAYLVLGDPQCTVTTISTDLDCWSSTSGGNGDGLPDGTEQGVADVNSGAGTGTMDATLTFGTAAFNTTGFTGTIAIVAQTLTLNAGLTHAGGTITITTGTVAAGANAVSITSAFTSSGSCSVTSGAMTIGVGGTLTADACTVTVSGNWDSSAGTFTGGTSTVVFSGSGSLAFASAGNFYAVTVDAGTTRTMTTDVRQFTLGGLLTVNGTIDASGGNWNWIHRYDNVIPIVIGGSGSFGTGVVYVAGHQSNWNLPGGTYYIIQVGMGNGITATAVGNVIVNGTMSIFYNGNFASSGLTTLNMGGFDLTVVGVSSIGFPGPPSRSGALVAGSGTFDLASVLIREAGSYIDFGPSTWTVSSTWDNSSTDAAWDAGSGTVTFTSATGGTMTFAGADLAEDEFNNVTFASSAGTSQTFTMATRGLRLGGTLTVSGVQAGVLTTLNTGGFNVTSSALTIGASPNFRGAFIAGASVVSINGNVAMASSVAYIQFDSSTWTISGTWTNSVTSANWDAGTSAVTFDSAAGGTMTFAGANLAEVEFNNVTFTSSAGTAQVFTMATRGLRLGGTLTISDTVSTTALNTSVGNLAVTAGVVTIGAGGILTANGSIITVSGNWDSRNGTFTYGTSTIVFAASGTFTVPVWTSQRSVYNVTINSGVSVTVPDGQGSVGIVNVLTVNGTLVFGTGAAIEAVSLFNDAGLTAPLVVGASSAYTGTVDRAEIEFFDQAGTLVIIPVDDYGNVFFKIAPAVAVAGDGFEYRFAGNIIVNRIHFNVRTAAPFFLNTQTFDLTIANIDDGVAMASPPAFGIKATSGTWTQSGGLFLDDTGSANFYLQLGSIAWNFISTPTTGFNWSLGAVTVGANWNVGTSTVTFSSPGGAAFRFAAGGNNFNNVTFQSSSASPDRFYAYTNDTTNPLRAAGTMTVSDTVSTTEFDVLNTGTPIDISVGAMTVGVGGILTGESSTITVSGNWNSGAGTFTPGTSTVVFAASGNLTTVDNGFTVFFFNLTINSGVTTTLQSATGAGGTVTVNGTLAPGAGVGFSLISTATSPVTPLVVGASGSVSSTSLIINYRYGGGTGWSKNVAGTAYYTLAFDQLNGLTGSVTWILNGDVSATLFQMNSANCNAVNSPTQTLNLNGLSFTASSTSTVGCQTTDGGTTVISAGGSTVSLANITIGSSAAPSAYITSTSLGSWTASGTWTNNSTSASWSFAAPITFTSATGGTMTFAGSNLTGDEFASVSFTGAATFTMATRDLRAETITVGSAATLAVGTLDLRFNHLDVDGVLTMDGITVGNIDIDASIGTITLTEWTLYEVTGGGIPDIRWTMDPDTANNNITFTVSGLQAFATFSMYRDGVEITSAGADGDGILVLSFATGWSPHDMIINLPGLSFGGGGGGGGGAVPTIQWTWRHLVDDLTVQFNVNSPSSLYTYTWYLDGRPIGDGSIFEYAFPRSGTYTIVLKAVIYDSSVIETPGDVIARSLSFVGQYLPVLLLMAVAVWYVLLVLADQFKADGGRLFGMGVALSAFAVSAWMLQQTFPTISVTGWDAIRLYFGVGALAAVGAIRSRVVGLALLVVGLGLLVPVYLGLLPLPV